MDTRTSPRSASTGDPAREDLRPIRRLAAAVGVSLAAVYVLYAGFASPGVLPARAVAPFLVAAVAGLLAIPDRRGAVARFLQVVWPLLVWAPLYDGAVRTVMLTPERYVDGWLAGADRVLLGAIPGTPAPVLGGPVEEIANLFYLSYYVAIPAGLLWAWRRRGEAAAVRYGLGILLAFASCAGIWLLAPAGGYHPGGSPTTEAWGPATAVVRWMYSSNPHYAAAFPSSHVALAFATAAMLVRMKASRWLWVWAAGVAWSTWQGQYHYLVDTPPGILAGVAAAGVALGTRGIVGVARGRSVLPLFLREE